MTAADEAREHEHRRESIERRVARVDEAITLWDAWEANQRRPPDAADVWPRVPPRGWGL